MKVVNIEFHSNHLQKNVGNFNYFKRENPVSSSRHKLEHERKMDRIETVEKKGFFTFANLSETLVSLEASIKRARCLRTFLSNSNK